MIRVFQQLNDNSELLQDQFGGDVEIQENGDAKFRQIFCSFLTTESNANLELTPDGSGTVKLGKNLNANSKLITNLAAPISDNDAARKKYVDDGLALKVSTSSLSSLSATLLTGSQPNITSVGTQAADLNMGTNKIVSLATPTLDTDASTKKYVDDGLALKVNTSSLSSLAATLSTGSQPNITSLGTLTGLSMGLNKITSLGAPTLDTDASTKKYVDDNLALKVNTSSLSSLAATLSTAAQPNITSVGTLTGLSMGTNKITSLGTPTLDTDATTKLYVDTADNLKLNLSGGTMSGELNMGNQKITNALSLNATTVTATTVNGTLSSGIQPGITSIGIQVGSLNMNSNKIINLGTPTLTTDATTKTYVDAADNLKLNLSGGTMSGAINMGSNAISGVTTLTATTVAGTLSTAAQANVTSLGTLTGLTMNGTITTPTNTNLTISPNGTGVTICKTMSRVYGYINTSPVVYFTQGTIDSLTVNNSASYPGVFTMTSGTTLRVTETAAYVITLTAVFADDTNERACEFWMFDNGAYSIGALQGLAYVDSNTSYANVSGTWLYNTMTVGRNYTFYFSSAGGATANLNNAVIYIERV